MQGVKDQVKGYLLDNFLMGGMDQDIQDEASLMDSHILDSTGFIELISYLEEQFQIQVSDDEMVPDNLDSLKNIAHFVSTKRALATSD
jgi:acyl carrier protein